jgi:hypothetical protein
MGFEKKILMGFFFYENKPNLHNHNKFAESRFTKNPHGMLNYSMSYSLNLRTF